MLARDENDYILAATLLNVALELHRETANKLGEGTTLRFMAIVSLLQGDARQGAQYLTASLAIYREFGALREIVLSAGIAGTLLARQGDFARGAALLRTALHHEEQQGFRFEDDIKTILNSGLDEVRRAALAPDWPTAAVERAVRNCLDMDGGQLAGFTLDTLRERFRYDL
jgi:hypothetical protein